ncbi:hypothetical protein EJD97_005981, partial [Solanum chilense]
VVHPWITLTEKELQMPYLITLGLVETIFDPVVDRVKIVLAGEITIKLLLLLVQDDTKGIPLLDDVVALYVRSMSDEATMSGGKNMSQLRDDFVWYDDMIDYVRGIRPTRGGMDWIDAERILTVMNISGNHLVTVEILLHEGLINFYDYNQVATENDKFFTLIQPVFGVLPKLLK